MINWKIHPRAVAANVTYLNDEDKTVAFDRVDRPTQTKTVADAVDQEGEKWTHIDAFGDPCRILIEEKDDLGYVVILRQSGHYATPAASSLKPIKPKLTKSQAWDRLNSGEFYNAQYGIDTLKHEYDIT